MIQGELFTIQILVYVHLFHYNLKKDYHILTMKRCGLIGLQKQSDWLSPVPLLYSPLGLGHVFFEPIFLITFSLINHLVWRVSRRLAGFSRRLAGLSRRLAGFPPLDSSRTF